MILKNHKSETLRNCEAISRTQSRKSYGFLGVRNHKSRSGFSLMEVLIAVGTLALGMLFIASVFPAGVYWTTVASERTISAVAADEAFAKIKLYGIPSTVLSTMSDTNQVSLSGPGVYPDAEYAYPSTPTDPNSKRYWWSAIGRREPNSLNDVQVTVFVSRKVGSMTTYPGAASLGRPIAVPVTVNNGIRNDELAITGNKTYINDGCTIVDSYNGQIYRVLERYPSNDMVIRLDKDWQRGVIAPPYNVVWVVPPPVGGGRYPCIAVYQKVMRF